LRTIFILCACVLCNSFFSQSISAYKTDHKWGYKNGESVVIDAQFDTALAFDQTNRIAAVGKTTVKRSLSSHDLKKEFSYSFINSANKKIYIHPTDAPDSICEFSMTKNMLANYMSGHDVFWVGYAGKKYLLTKNGKQISGPLDNIYFTPVPNFFMTEYKENTGMVFHGIIDDQGKQIIPPSYSRIVIDAKDSIIIGCTAGIKTGGFDDLFNFAGDKKFSSHRHIDHAYKNVIVYKLHEPEVSYIVQDLSDKDKKERPLKASWAYYLPNGVMVYLQGKDHYFFYKLKEDKKIPFDGRLYWFFHLTENEQD
jgi:hypothetical protein